MKLTQEKLNTFKDIYFDSYGAHIETQEAELVIQDITSLLEEIIKINYLKNYEKKELSN